MFKRCFVVLTVAFWLVACHDRDRAVGEKNAEKPIDVASAVASCTDLDDCNSRCAENNANACVSAGRMYEFGHGVFADPSAAFPLYEKACDLNYAGGCYNTAVLLESGKGVTKDLEHARQLYAKVCAMGATTSCERAAKLGSNQQKP